MSALFAATYPERVSHLILCRRLFPRRRFVAQGDDACATGKRLAYRVKNWGNGDILKGVLASQAQDPNAVALGQNGAAVQHAGRDQDHSAA